MLIIKANIVKPYLPISPEFWKKPKEIPLFQTGTKFKNGKIFTEHPKFSINTGISPYLVDYHPEDVPNNLYFSAYYCF